MTGLAALVAFTSELRQGIYPAGNVCDRLEEIAAQLRDDLVELDILRAERIDLGRPRGG